MLIWKGQEMDNEDFGTVNRDFEVKLYYFTRVINTRIRAMGFENREFWNDAQYCLDSTVENKTSN